MPAANDRDVARPPAPTANALRNNRRVVSVKDACSLTFLCWTEFDATSATAGCVFPSEQTKQGRHAAGGLPFPSRLRLQRDVTVPSFPRPPLTLVVRKLRKGVHGGESCSTGTTVFELACRSSRWHWTGEEGRSTCSLRPSVLTQMLWGERR